MAADHVPDAAATAVGMVTVWWANPHSLRPWHLELLSTVETDKWRAYIRQADRDRSALAAVLLRLVAAAATGEPPRSIRIGRDCQTCGKPHGRPRLVDHGYEVSVSHSGQRVVVAITDAGPVGVDVEQITQVDLTELATAVLADDEQLTEPQDFFVYWTRKESLVKATGEGLRVPLREVVVSTPAEPPALRRYPGRQMTAVLVDLHPGDGHIAALAVVGTPAVQVDERDAALLLADRRDAPTSGPADVPDHGAAGRDAR